MFFRLWRGSPRSGAGAVTRKKNIPKSKDFVIIQSNLINSRIIMGPVEVIAVDSKKVACDGTNHKLNIPGADASSHPLVYLNMGEKDSVVCPYCSKCFTIKKNPKNS
jgi:uncharacterized Zn-finger protein